MMCCNRKRRTMHQGRPSAASRRRPTVRIKYLGVRRITVLSLASMRSYTFDPSTEEREQLVTEQDARLFLRRRAFRRVG